MSLVQEKNRRFLQKQETFEVCEHPVHKRLYQINIANNVIQNFLKSVADVNVQQLEYVPYMRYVLAGELQNSIGDDFVQTIRDILQDRDSGGFTTGVNDLTQNDEDYVKFSTALSHLIGKVNFDAMSGKYYARFTVQHTDSSDSYLRQAYRNMTLHTDGTFVEEDTDWLLMMKFEEENAVGGESRLLHLDDWEDLDYYSEHTLATYKFKYSAPASKQVDHTVYNSTFYKQNNKACVCFIDQFAYPDTIEQANYLKGFSDSMENSPATKEIGLPNGDLVMVNNHFWLHGRAAFEENTKLHRELLRQRGSFDKV